MKNILATVIGLIIANLVVYLLEFIGHWLFPMPPEINLMDMESIKQNVHLIPIGNMVFVILAHGLGLFAGIITVGFISKTSLIPIYIVGGLMAVATIANLIIIPSPVWFIFCDLASVALAFYFGKKIAQNKLMV